MKKIILVALIFGLFPLTFSEGAVKIESFTIGREGEPVFISWPRLLDEESKQQGKLEKLNQNFAETTQKLFLESYENYSSGLPIDHYKFFSTYETPYHTDKFTSLVQEYYIYTGGANGNVLFTSLTYDWSKEKEIHLEDLFLSEVNYQDELTQKVKAEIKKRDKEEAYSFFKEVHSATKFYFSSEGLVLLYSPYEIAPRVEGTVRVILPWQELRNILKEEFRSL